MSRNRMTRSTAALCLVGAVYFGSTACSNPTTKNPVAACSLAPTSQIQQMASSAYPRLQATSSTSTTLTDGDSRPHNETTDVCDYSTDRLAGIQYVGAQITTVNTIPSSRDKRFIYAVRGFDAKRYVSHDYVPSADATQALNNMRDIAWIVPASQAKASAAALTPYGLVFVSNDDNVVVTVMLANTVQQSMLIQLAQTVDGNVQKMLASSAANSSSGTTSPATASTGSASASSRS